MKKKMWAYILTAVVLTAIAVPAGARLSKTPKLLLSTTTSTVDSGLLDYLLQFFEKGYHVKVEAIAVGTGKALKLGENCDVDVVLVHAREMEDEFVKDGFGVNRRDVMHNDFLIVGPPSDPAGIRGAKSATDAFRKIEESQARFISRADKSGTDVKEKEIWKSAKITPGGKWYMESGQGMGATLTMADELEAYTLVDRATFLSYQAKVNLAALYEKEAGLLNPYGVIAVNPKKCPSTHYDLAMKFIDWITSKDGQQRIGAYKMKGTQLFTPDAVKK